MKTIDDCTYQEYKDDVKTIFGRWKKSPDIWTPKMVTDCLSEEEQYAEYPLVGTSIFLWVISVGEYEVRHNILEERIRKHLCYHIYRYENMGRYKSDLTEEEIEQVERDIAYIKSKVELPKLVSYEDFY